MFQRIRENPLIVGTLLALLVAIWWPAPAAAPTSCEDLPAVTWEDLAPVTTSRPAVASRSRSTCAFMSHQHADGAACPGGDVDTTRWVQVSR